MRWYERLYVGEKAKKHRYETIQAVRNGQAFGFYVLTPAAGDRNLLDIYPALTLKLPYYQKQMRRCLQGGSFLRPTKRPADTM